MSPSTETAKEGVARSKQVASKPKSGRWTNTQHVSNVKGIVAPAKKLSKTCKIDNLGILAQGDKQGSITVGADKVTANKLHAKGFKERAQYLSLDAKVYVFGCLGASDKEGIKLLMELSKLLPGRDVIGFNTLTEYRPVNAHKEGGHWYDGGTYVVDHKIMSASFKDQTSTPAMMHPLKSKEYEVQVVEADQQAPHAKIATDVQIIIRPTDESSTKIGAASGPPPLAKPRPKSR